MSIEEFKEKIKAWQGRVVANEKDLFLGLLVVILTLGGFGLGRLTKIEDQKMPVRIEKVNLDSLPNDRESASVSLAVDKTEENQTSIITKPTADQQASAPSSAVTPGNIVASKNGTKYYLTSCSGAKRIKAENKVYFASAEEARQAGLTAAANCPGL